MSRRSLPYWITAAVLVGTGILLLSMGHTLICKCGYVLAWNGVLGTDQNSQHLTDWWTASHIIHGFLFYWFLWLVARKLPIGWRFAMATAIEAFWEILENTPLIMDRYRTATISLDYFGDSVINSLSDIVAMMIGFALARTVPVWASVAIVIGLETTTMILIRDGLILNIAMLVWPMQAILDWQNAL